MALRKSSKQSEFLEAISKLTKKLKCHGEIKTLPELKDNLTREELMRLAIMMGNEQTIRQYLQLGADANARDSKQNSLLELANAYGHPKIAELLKEFGATTKRRSTPTPKLKH